MRKTILIPACALALLGPAGAAEAAPQLATSVGYTHDGSAGAAGGGGDSESPDHGSELSGKSDPVQQEDERSHITKDVEDEADSRDE